MRDSICRPKRITVIRKGEPKKGSEWETIPHGCLKKRYPISREPKQYWDSQEQRMRTVDSENSKS